MIPPHKITTLFLSLMLSSTAVVGGGILQGDDALAALLAAGLITLLLKERRANSHARSAALQMRTFPRYTFAPEWPLYANARFPLDSMQMYRSLPYFSLPQPFF